MAKTANELVHQNLLNIAYRKKGKELDRPLTPGEKQAIRARIDKEHICESADDNGYHVISQKDLLSMKVKPISFLVEGLLVTPGLCLLGGKKKSNKSWIALDLSQSIASGTRFLNKEVKTGKVLFYALEDSIARLHDRLKKLKTDNSLPVSYAIEILPLNRQEGMASLEDAIKLQRPALTIIDTLANAIDKSLDENKASDMSDLMKQLRSLAIQTDSCILILLHHGKKTFGDAGFDFRGSSAIPSASDVNISLYKSAEGHTLLAEGRDISDTAIKLWFDKEIWRFQLRGDSRSEHRAEIEDTIKEIVGELGEADTVTIGGQLGISRIAARDYLLPLVADKQLISKQVRTGQTFKILYSLPPEIQITTVTPLHREDTVTNETKVNDVTPVSKVTEVDNKERCNEVTTVTPISEVKAKEIAPDVIRVGGFREILGQQGNEGLPCYKDDTGNCALRLAKKSSFSCAYEPVKPDGSRCYHWRPK